MKVLFLSIVFVAAFYPVLSDNFQEQKKQNYIMHGTSLFRKARDSFNKNYLKNTVTTIREFLLLYPDHPDRMEAMKLLSQSYKKAGLYARAIKIDTEIYLENPATEDGIRSYLSAAKSYFKIGETGKARYILESIKGQDYISSLAEDADLELKIMNILNDQD